MFDLPVAQALFSHLLTPAQGPHASSSSSRPPAQDPQQLAATFAALKKQRSSKVTEQQRQQMYRQLAAQMEALPPIFVRTADCGIVPLGGVQGAVASEGGQGCDRPAS